MSPRRDMLQRRLLWLSVGILAYLGAGLMLLAALMPAFSEEGLRFEAVGPEHLGALLISLGLFILGGYAARRLRGGTRPGRGGQSTLPESYQPSVAQQIGGDGESEADATQDAEGKLTCANCGATNDQFFTYCSECSEKL